MRVKSKLRNFKICNLQFAICNSQLGLTLIEVLVALSVLAIGLLGVALMQVTSISGGIFSREMVTATALSQDMLEKLRTLPYEDSALASGDHPDATDVARGQWLAVGVGSDNIIDELGKTDGPRLYTRTWKVTDNTPATNMKSIEVTVSWLEKGQPPVTRKVIITGVKVRE